MPKIKVGKFVGGLLGDKVVGFLYTENYDSIVFGFCIWNYGVWVILVNDKV